MAGLLMDSRTIPGDKTLMLSHRAIPAPGTTPDSKAHRVARQASSQRAFRSPNSKPDLAPKRNTVTPPVSFARRSCSFSASSAVGFWLNMPNMCSLRFCNSEGNPLPPEIRQYDDDTVTFSALPSISAFTAPMSMPSSCSTATPPVRAAISNSKSLR